MNDIIHTNTNVDPAELAKLNEENALKGLDKGAGVDTQPVVEHKVAKAEKPSTKEA